MSLASAGLLSSPSAYTPTGGTAVTFESAGFQPDGRLLLQVNADTDTRTRRKMFVKVKQPVVKSDAPNGYTQARSELRIEKPKVLANGKITVNSITISMAHDVEATSAEKDDLMGYALQSLYDTDFSNFWKAQSTT